MRRYQWPIGAILFLLACVFGLSLVASGSTRAQTVDTRGPQTKPASGQITTSSGQPSAANAALPAPARPNVVLYDQYTPPSGGDVTSQDFEAAFDAYDSQAADDFAVPSGQSWIVNEVDAGGDVSSVHPTLFNIYFYANSGTLPATPVYTATGQAATEPTTGNYVITLSSPATLAGGATYWVSVQARLDFTGGGQWYWQNRTTQSTSPAAWRNPGGGFATTCANWGVKTVCLPTQVGPDQIYRLVGTVGAQGTPTSTPTGGVPTATATATACATNLIQNGGFETGSLSPWVVQDTSPAPVVSNAQAHSGTYSALLGTVSGGEPNGNGSLYQGFTVPAGATLSFWYYPGTTDTINFDWQDVYLTDSAGNILATILHVCENDRTWKHVTFNLAPYAGQSVRVKFLVHQDGFGDDTYMYVDDVQVLGACGTATATPTGPAPTATTTRTATPAASGTPVCPPPAPITGSITTSDPTENGRVFRGGTPSACGAPNTPGNPIAGTYHYDAYTYTNNSSGQICVTASVDATGCTNGFIFAAAYLGSFDPNNITANLIGDAGSSPNPTGSFGFNVPAGANFVIVISEVTANAGCGSYTLAVTTDAVCGAVTPTTTATSVPPTLTRTAVPATQTATAVPPTLTRTAVPPTLTATRTAPAATGTAPAATATRTAPAATNTPAATETPCTINFSDVHPTDYFYEPVRYLYCHGVISGYADGTFRPYNQTTRSQMVKIVVLGFNKPIATPTAGGYTFADVPPSNPFYSYIETAASLNIVSGYTCGTVPGEPCDAQNRPYFRPYANVTRGQLSKIDVVAAGWTVINPATQTFADVFPNTAFYTFVETAYCHGIISGYNCGTVPGEPCDAQNRPYFRQFNDATRGQIAKIVYLSITNPPGSCATP